MAFFQQSVRMVVHCLRVITEAPFLRILCLKWWILLWNLEVIQSSQIFISLFADWFFRSESFYLHEMGDRNPLTMHKISLRIFQTKVAVSELTTRAATQPRQKAWLFLNKLFLLRLLKKLFVPFNRVSFRVKDFLPLIEIQDFWVGHRSHPLISFMMHHYVLALVLLNQLLILLKGRLRRVLKLAHHVVVYCRVWRQFMVTKPRVDLRKWVEVGSLLMA